MHRGHQANEVTFLLIGEKEGAFFFFFFGQGEKFQGGRRLEKGSPPERKLVGKLKFEWKSSIFFHLHVADTNGGKPAEEGREKNVFIISFLWI